MKGRTITICLPYYRNAGMLKEQCRRLRVLPNEMKEWLRLIVVDDGSAILQAGETELPAVAVAAKHEDIGMPFELYRLLVNKRWNQDAARNLAVDRATSEWLLLTDIDHMPIEETLRAVIGGKFDREMVYRFSRATLWPTGQIDPYKPHPNSWFMTKAMYNAIGGYDESFAGLYGTDADFKERVWAKIGEPTMLPDILLRVPRETIPDASTVTYGRKEPQDGQLKDLRRRRNATPGWQTQRLTFPWERVA